MIVFLAFAEILHVGLVDRLPTTRNHKSCGAQRLPRSKPNSQRTTDRKNAPAQVPRGVQNRILRSVKWAAADGKDRAIQQNMVQIVVDVMRPADEGRGGGGKPQAELARASRVPFTLPPINMELDVRGILVWTILLVKGPGPERQVPCQLVGGYPSWKPRNHRGKTGLLQASKRNQKVWAVFPVSLF